MPTEDIIQWSATLSGVIAAIMVAFNLSAKMAGWGIVVFIFSAILWIAFG